MMKFKVGDKVRVRNDLVVWRLYHGCSFAKGMKVYKGKIATVLEVLRENWYILDVGDHKWIWSDEMLEPAGLTKGDLKPGDIVTMRNGETYTVGEGGYINNMYSCNNKLLNDDLTNGGTLGRALDIVKVERPRVIWEREEKKTNEDLHREMWNWLAENPEKQKSDWFDKEDVDALDECFACEECNSNCEKCPLDRGVIGCNKSCGLYRMWLESEDADVRRALAKVISVLPWKSVE